MNNNNAMNSKAMLQVVLDSIPLRVFWKDVSLNFTGANELFLRDAGLSHVNQIIGKSDYDMCWGEEKSNRYRQDDLRVINSGKAKINIEEPLTKSDGSTVWLLTSKVPTKNQRGEVTGLIGTYRDITEQVLYREEIEAQALQDPLTHLPNRRTLYKSVSQFSGKSAALIFIDLDHFKDVNDSLGHSVGDELLKMVALRLQEATDNTILVARLGGDEFSIFVPLIDVPTTKQKHYISSIMMATIHHLLQPFHINGHTLNLGVSAGITFIKGNENTSSTATSDRFCEADIAMYEAKKERRNSFRFYTNTMQEAVQRRYIIQNELSKAISNKELQLVYQPQVDHNGNLTGAEALLRWKSKSLGVVSPTEFITIAEQCGLIHSIGQWVLESAFSVLASWQALLKNSPNFTLAINISSKQFNQRDFVSSLMKTLSNYAIDPKHIQLEITESLFIENEQLIMESMQTLRNLGISFAIDDFGIGYSSIAYLVNLDIEKLKIDRSFITNMNTNTKNKKLVDTIINMAKNLDVDVIAEGVETLGEKKRLVELGCHQFQGFYFSHPVTIEKMSDVLSQQTINRTIYLTQKIAPTLTGLTEINKESTI